MGTPQAKRLAAYLSSTVTDPTARRPRQKLHRYVLWAMNFAKYECGKAGYDQSTVETVARCDSIGDNTGMHAVRSHLSYHSSGLDDLLVT